MDQPWRSEERISSHVDFSLWGNHATNFKHIFYCTQSLLKWLYIFYLLSIEIIFTFVGEICENKNTNDEKAYNCRQSKPFPTQYFRLQIENFGWRQSALKTEKLCNEKCGHEWRTSKAKINVLWIFFFTLQATSRHLHSKKIKNHWLLPCLNCTFFRI